MFSAISKQALHLFLILIVVKVVKVAFRQHLRMFADYFNFFHNFVIPARDVLCVSYQNDYIAVIVCFYDNKLLN